MQTGMFERFKQSSITFVLKWKISLKTFVSEAFCSKISAFESIFTKKSSRNYCNINQQMIMKKANDKKKVLQYIQGEMRILPKLDKIYCGIFGSILGIVKNIETCDSINNLGILHELAHKHKHTGQLPFLRNFDSGQENICKSTSNQLTRSVEFQSEDNQKLSMDEFFGDRNSDDEQFYGFNLDSEEEAEENDDNDGEDETDLPEQQRQEAALQAYRHNWPLDFPKRWCRFPFEENPIERDIFFSVFNNEVFKLLVQETNLYAEQEIE